MHFSRFVFVKIIVCLDFTHAYRHVSHTSFAPSRIFVVFTPQGLKLLHNIKFTQ